MHKYYCGIVSYLKKENKQVKILYKVYEKLTETFYNIDLSENFTLICDVH